MDKNQIQREIDILKIEIFKAQTEKKRIEKDYIDNGDKYVDMYRIRLMKNAVAHEEYIIRCQRKIDKLRAKLKKIK